MIARTGPVFYCDNKWPYHDNKSSLFQSSFSVTSLVLAITSPFIKFAYRDNKSTDGDNLDGSKMIQVQVLQSSSSKTNPLITIIYCNYNSAYHDYLSQ